MIGAAANVQRVCMDACGERGDVRSKTPVAVHGTAGEGTGAQQRDPTGCSAQRGTGCTAHRLS